MSSENPTKDKIFSPSRTVWRTQMAKGIYTPHRVSRITCIVNELLSEKVSDFLNELGVIVYIENGRVVREIIKPRPFNLPGEIVKLQDTPVDVFRFTVPRETFKEVINYLIDIAELDIPGRGTVFSQDLMEFSKEPPSINLDFFNTKKAGDYKDILLNKLSYVVCVLSIPGSGELISKIALDLGICVPLVTFGSGNDIRDQLGLIRITISAEKEIVHLVMPEQDSESIIRVLIEQGHLDRPGRGFIYQTPVTMGLLDTYLKIGQQKYAASIEQIIAAVDQLKSGTGWRKRLDAEHQEKKAGKSLLPQDNCEISIISDEDRIDRLREACLKVGATGATTARVMPLAGKGEESVTSTMIRSAISVPADITDNVVDILLEASTIKDDTTDRIHVLDSPAAYVHSL
ncbi:MAG: hypothetical protein A2Z69_00585 [Bacteroidetes bacterium RBG_13_44_24]|nr:MAG: hypothetical protein A2Z69_00585 [Bacteroidetes bacterium RBG_13_44_24]OFY60088.1 MAG: hypothetical protein A2V50_05070 [Bacteroidetes bacterium RBG_19FT_COMBO_42_10]